jgi:hypothetical protein
MIDDKNRIFIENLTKMNQESQNQKLKLFAKVDISTKLEILDQQKQFFHKHKTNYNNIDNRVLTLISLILAINYVLNKLDNVNINAIKFRVNNKCKSRDKLLRYWAILKELREKQGLSFRKISNYFEKYHKFKVSYSFISKIWKEIEGGGNDGC